MHLNKWHALDVAAAIVIALLAAVLFGEWLWNQGIIGVPSQNIPYNYSNGSKALLLGVNL